MKQNSRKFACRKYKKLPYVGFAPPKWNTCSPPWAQVCCLRNNINHWKMKPNVLLGDEVTLTDFLIYLLRCCWLRTLWNFRGAHRWGPSWFSQHACSRKCILCCPCCCNWYFLSLVFSWTENSLFIFKGKPDLSKKSFQTATTFFGGGVKMWRFAVWVCHASVF